jgi:cytochrome c oxidase subunit 2
VPINQPVKLIMTSQDVIHSFYVPAFRIKQDVLPGRYTTMWFEATNPASTTFSAPNIAAQTTRA